MSTEELIVITNVGLILVTLVGIGASIFANDRLADITRSAVNRLMGAPPEYGKHERND